MEPELIDQFDRTHTLLLNIDNPDRHDGDKGWTIREIVGHLIDSASNNHQRLVRYAPGGEISFPGYDQEQCVERSAYRSFNKDRIPSFKIQNS